MRIILWEKYNHDLDTSKHNKNEDKGVVYVIEYGDYIKIGSTLNMKTRYSQLYNQATRYGNVKLGECYITPKHERFRETEKRFHKKFDTRRKGGTELFDIPLKEFVDSTDNFELDYSPIDHKGSDAFINGLINSLSKGLHTTDKEYL